MCNTRNVVLPQINAPPPVEVFVREFSYPIQMTCVGEGDGCDAAPSRGWGSVRDERDLDRLPVLFQDTNQAIGTTLANLTPSPGR